MNIVIAESRLNSNVWVALKRAVLGVLVRYTLSCHGTVPSAEKKDVKASRILPWLPELRGCSVLFITACSFNFNLP